VFNAQKNLSGSPSSYNRLGLKMIHFPHVYVNGIYTPKRE